ncbi:hypothetical protein D3C80_1867920 [compost metagenome]
MLLVLVILLFSFLALANDWSNHELLLQSLSNYDYSIKTTIKDTLKIETTVVCAPRFIFFCVSLRLF